MARHNDARPVIDRYELKKDMSPCPFPIFTAGDVVLCISGEDRVNAAAATSYLLTRWGRDGLFVHLGPADTNPGVSYPHTISDGDEIVYQEMLFKHPFEFEGRLEEGEAVYAFSAAARFLPLKQIVVLRYCKDFSKDVCKDFSKDTCKDFKTNEGMFLWLETICFGMTSFPTSMWKTGRRIMT